jgi:hypothetical protein
MGKYCTFHTPVSRLGGDTIFNPENKPERYHVLFGISAQDIKQNKEKIC